MLRTANITREDFNIEDIHCQVVVKLQRQKKVLREIEQLPGEREQEDFFLDDEFSHKNKGTQRSSKGKTYYPMLVVRYAQEQIICGDACNKPTISFGIKN